eukprot:TRINITY_DN44553_c0_g1_i1.p1 TRINITY_DN44553_c0_g1~~TRINITY_DN44553_c0_g1_i1.p1  ORF type:complete len:792 (+),score=112.85 TRINITY_DN44553_c0_g1_i1:161-2536(+)
MTSCATADDSCGRLVVIIAGPTAVGKSAVALEIANLLPTEAELIGADSVQVYRGLDIGSNKASHDERNRCPLHLVDWMDPRTPCNANAWTQEALRIIDDLHGRGLVPVVVGGSCMYLDWLVHGEPDSGKSDPWVQAEIVEELRPFEERGDWIGALRTLVGIAPEMASRITPNNWRQLARHLEIARTPSAKGRRSSREKYDMRCFFLSPRDRHALFHRIDERCLQMLRKGLFEEVAGLLENGLFEPETPAGLAIGYRQVFEYLSRPEPIDDDQVALRGFIHGFATVSRNYASSQMQWFMKDKSFTWVPADHRESLAVAREIVRLVALSPSAFEEAAAADVVVRKAQVAQGAMMASFTSRLDAYHLSMGGSAEDDVLATILPAADLCTRRVPSALRMVKKAPPVTLKMGELTFGPVFWGGRHKKWGWGAPLGKLHKQGLQLFEGCGWRQIDENDDAALPVFCWPPRKAGSFPAHDSIDVPLPLIRPFPQEFTRRLDDKGELAAHLVAAGHAEIHPSTWSAEDFLNLQFLDDIAGELWFLKHRQGATGIATQPYARVDALRKRLDELGERGRRALLVQRGVAPPALRCGRKWLLRAHLLLHGTGDKLALYCHKDIVLLEHAQPYSAQVEMRAAHVCSAGKPKLRPKPDLLEDNNLAEQIRRLAARCFASVWQHAPRGPYAPSGAELCQLFSADAVVDASGQAWLLGVSDYPDIASGTMEHVDTQLYTGLVRDVLRFVVLPRLSGSKPESGGFLRLDVEAEASTASVEVASTTRDYERCGERGDSCDLNSVITTR